MKRPLPLLLPLALASLLLPACGARSSLTENGASGECVPWIGHDGAAELRTSLLPAVVLDDGSVVVSIAEGHDDADGGAGVTWTRSWLRKIDPDGAIAWEVGDAAGARLVAPARDAENAIYVTGHTEPAAQSVLGYAVTCAAQERCSFVAKLTQAGQPSWVKAFPLKSAEDRLYLRHIAVTDDGRITLGGGFQGTLDLGCGPASGTADGPWRNFFVAQLSPSGECLWSRAIAPSEQATALDRMAVDGAGDVALTLSLDGPPGSSVDFGGGPVPFGGDSHLASFAVANYAPDGAFVFAKAATCGFTFGLPSVAVTDAGEVLLSASCTGTIDLGGGPKGSVDVDRVSVTKFDAAGEELWTRDVATTSLGGQAPPVIATEPGGSFVLAGQVWPGMALLGAPAPEKALFVAAFDAGGSPINTKTFPQPLTEFVDVVGISASVGSLVLDGIFDGTLDLGQGPLVSEGPQDAFVASICR